MAGSNALVTGGVRGIGLEISKKLAAKGLHVYATTRNGSRLPRDMAKQVTVIECDFAQDSWRQKLLQELPKIDVLINNAGHLNGFGLDQYDSDKRDYMLRLNLIAPVELAWHVGLQMKERGGGRIVNNTSIAAHVGHPDIWYGATKAGLLNATKSLARTLGDQGVLVNAVAAGPVEGTEMLSDIPEERKAAIKKASISGRFAQPDEVAACIEWLALDSPPYVNGICIDINNGTFMR